MARPSGDARSTEKGDAQADSEIEASLSPGDVPYEAERSEMIALLTDLTAWRFIDCAGGELSRRCGDDHVLITPTGSAFHRWHLQAEDLVVIDLDGRLISKRERLAPGGSSMHLAIFRLFPLAKAVIHAHVPYSLVFATQGRSIPSVTNLMDTLGEVPCLVADDDAVKREFAEGTAPAVRVPDGLVQRPEVFAIHTLHHVPQLEALLGPRADELSRHGLAFTLYRHGIYVFARSFDEAFENLARIESNAQAALLAGG